MIVEKLEDTLNGGYSGLYGEVVTEDTYRLRSLTYRPDIIIDIGANVGIFTRYARELFPYAQIISIEPDPENFAHLKKFTNDDNTIFINKALGIGNIYHGLTARNGSGETYLSSGLGYPDEEMMVEHSVEKSEIKTITIDKLVKKYVKESMKVLLKVDCEGAENSIWGHKPSMEALKNIDYICFELHFYSLHGGAIWEEVQNKTKAALKQISETHNCELEHIHFYARKK